jgi:hypothetical protein
MKTPEQQRQLLASFGLVGTEEPKAEAEERDAEDGREFYAALLNRNAAKNKAQLRALGVDLPPDPDPDADPARPQFDGGNREYVTPSPEHSLPKGVVENDEPRDLGWGRGVEIENGVSLLLGEPDATPEPPTPDEEREVDGEHGRFMAEFFGGEGK